MPSDLRLDRNTHDLDISKGTLRFITNNEEVVGQRLKIALLTKQGEWFMDTNVGLPYYQEFFTKKNNKPLIDQTIISYASRVEDVERVRDYSSTIRNDRVLEVSLTVETYTGEIVKVAIGGLNA